MKMRIGLATRDGSASWFIGWSIMICLVISACQAQAAATQPQTTVIIAEKNPSELNQTLTPRPSLTLTPVSSLTATDLPAATEPAYQPGAPSPHVIGPQILHNGGFDTGVQGWERPYGALQHTTSEFHTGPGAARLITNSASGFLDYRGSMGQCVDLTDFLTVWPEYEGQLYMTLEAYLRTDGEITKVSLNGIFLDDPHCGTGQTGFFEIPSLESDQTWTRLSGTRSIPAEARSFHVFINASGKTETANVFIDDLRAYPAEYPP